MYDAQRFIFKNLMGFFFMYQTQHKLLETKDNKQYWAKYNDLQSNGEKVLLVSGTKRKSQSELFCRGGVGLITGAFH